MSSIKQRNSAYYAAIFLHEIILDIIISRATELEGIRKESGDVDNAYLEGGIRNLWDVADEISRKMQKLGFEV